MRYRSMAHAGAAAALVALMAASPARAAGDAVGAIGSQPVTAAELKGLTEGMNPQQREQAAKNPQIAAQLVREAIARKLVLDAAAKEGLEKKPEVAAEIERAREQILLSTYMAAAAPVPADFPSDDDVRKIYDANREHNFQYHLAQIYIAEPPQANMEQFDAVVKKVYDLAAKARAKNADFAALARANSQDTATAPKGGDLGWLAQSQLTPQILGAVMALGGKGVTDPIHVQGGWHIVEVLAQKPADFDQVKPQIMTLMREAKAQQLQQAYLEKLLTDDKVTVNETAAAALFATK
jgi:parvulin-like peptidyl-prolyl isomerase